MTLDWQTLHVPFVGGLQQKQDPRALEPPGLTRAINVQFDEIGGLQLRKPFTNLSNTGLSNVRRVYSNGDELIVFTKTQLLSYTPSNTTTPWAVRGTHLAIKVDEATKYATTGDQIEADRAELNNTVIYCWTDSNKVYVAAEDKTTGATITGPTAWGSGVTANRPRAVALATKILVFANDQSALGLKAIAIDPADPATGIASTPTSIVPASDNYNLYYDVVKIPFADTAFLVSRLNPTTSYIAKKVTSALAVTSATKARTCDGPIAVSVDPTGATAQVIRANGTNIQGDRITVSSLADAATNQAVGTANGTPVNQIAAAHRSVQDGGAYRCYVFFSEIESAGLGLGFRCKVNYVDTAGTIGTQSVLRYRLGVASRAFDYNGEVYVWGVFGGSSNVVGMAEPLGFRAQLQNTYFLYRDDGHLASKAVWQRGGGFSPSTGRLPNVALTSGSTTYSWAAAERRIIPLGTDHTGYDARAPRDVTFTFDSDDARRTARLGRTLYVAGGLPIQYDGAALWELGFLVYPWLFSSSTGVAGSIASGDYAYKSTLRFDNAKGERERSTTATTGKITLGSSLKVDFQIANLHITRKGTRPTHEIWRTAVNPTAVSPFYLATGLDPSVLTGDNAYLLNGDNTTEFTDAWTDNFADATLTTKQSFPENGDVLESLAPPAASIIIASDTRLFLAGVAGDPDRVWYSKLRGDGEVAAFHDSLVADVPRDGGRITALAIHEETLVVFRERAIYALPGDGFDNVGQGQNFGPARTLATDVGAISQETVARGPFGTIFKSSKGWYLLRGWSVEYIGDKVSDYDSETVVAVHVVEKQHQVRILSSSRCLVWDYLAPGQPWAEWTITSAVGACMWNGTHTIAKTADVSTEATSYSGVNYGIDVETAWIKLNGLQGFGAVRWFSTLGEYRGACILQTRVARNYRDYAAPGESKDFTPGSVLSTGEPLQFRYAPKTANGVQAIKVRLTTFGTGAVKATMSTGSGGSWSSGGTVTTSGTAWSATLRCKSVGTDGNSVLLNVFTCQGTGVEVKDNSYFDGTNWVDQVGTVGVRVGVGATVAQLERAIDDTSRYIEVSTPDASPTKVIVDSDSNHVGNVFSGGADTAPTTEQVALTGLSFEVGFKPGIYKRLPAAQRG